MHESMHQTYVDTAPQTHHVPPDQSCHQTHHTQNVQPDHHYQQAQHSQNVQQNEQTSSTQPHPEHHSGAIVDETMSPFLSGNEPYLYQSSLQGGGRSGHISIFHRLMIILIGIVLILIAVAIVRQ